jgi:hypothetical protein
MKEGTLKTVRMVLRVRDGPRCGVLDVARVYRPLNPTIERTAPPIARIVTARPAPLSPVPLPSFGACGASDRVNRCAHCPHERVEWPRAEAARAAEWHKAGGATKIALRARYSAAARISLYGSPDADRASFPCRACRDYRGIGAGHRRGLQR